MVQQLLTLVRMTVTTGVEATQAAEETTRLFGLDMQLIHDTLIMAVNVFLIFFILSYLVFNPARKMLSGRREKVEADIEDNIIGLNVLTGFDNTKGSGKTKKIKLDGNVFFLNRESDVQMTVSPSIAKVRVDAFEDLEGTDGIESIEDNEDLKDPKAFAGRINAKYLNAFLSMKYSESTKLDEGKCNGLRSVFGLPLQGTITTACDMYANRYPLDDALRLFGAMSGKGAQAIK